MEHFSSVIQIVLGVKLDVQGTKTGHKEGKKEACLVF